MKKLRPSAPERILLHDASAGITASGKSASECVPYVRADLLEQAQKRIAELESIINNMVERHCR